MAVSVVNVGVDFNGGGAGTTYSNVTVPAGLTDSALVIVVAVTGSGVNTGWSAEWDQHGTTPQPMTLLVNRSNTDQQVVIFGLRNPRPGNLDCAILQTGGVGFRVAGVVLQEVNQASDAAAFTNANSAIGTSGNPSVTINSAAGDLVIAAFDGTSNFTSVSGTQIFINNTGSAWGAASNYGIGTAPSVTLSGTPTATHWTAAGINVSASSPGGPTGGQQIINVGSAINDGTGDPVRTAFTKSNENFSELYGVKAQNVLDKLRLAAGANWSFTENDLRVTKVGGGGSYDPVFSQPATQMYDYLYFEATIMQYTTGIFIGVCNNNLSSGAGIYPGINPYSAGFHGNGSHYYNGANTSPGTYPMFTTGDTIAIAVAVPFGYVWLRNITTNSFWNNSSGYNPASSPPNGAAGGAFLYNMGAIFAVTSLYAATESVRFNFDGTFSGPVPVGYRRWSGGP